MHTFARYAFPSFAVLCGLTASRAGAAVIGIDGFSGDETVIGFDTEFDPIHSKPIGDVTITMVQDTDDVYVGSIDWTVLFQNLPEYTGGHAAETNGQVPSFRVYFANEVHRAGLALGNVAIGYNWTVGAFDAFHNVLGQDVFVRPDDGYAVFAGFESATPIAYLEIFDSGAGNTGTVFDDIRFESVTHEVPEPATMALFGLGVLIIGSRRVVA